MARARWPRTGDRVIVSPGDYAPNATLTHTRTGEVLGVADADGRVLIHLDGWGSGKWFPKDMIREVVDRPRADWPDGWSLSEEGRPLLRYVGDFDRGEIVKILAAGPYILEHWDELVGEE